MNFHGNDNENTCSVYKMITSQEIMKLIVSVIYYRLGLMDTYR